MNLFRTVSAFALGVAALGAGSSAFAQQASANPAASSTASDRSPQLGEVIVTAQKRSTNLQTTPMAITAVGGQDIKKDAIVTFADLAHSVPALSYSQNNALRQEYNIRGAVNTRLGSPTADQSVGLFSDGVYVSRAGVLNPTFFDIGQVEIIRGPQGVLLGRNVAGGAISVTSAPPMATASGAVTVGYGDYGAVHSDGYFTGPIAQDLTGRFSFQTDNHDGYSHDLFHHVDLDNLNQYAFRGQLLFRPAGTGFSAHLTLEYTHEDNNGMCPIAEPDTAKGDPNSAPGLELHPWSSLRAQTGLVLGSQLTNRQCLPTWPTFAGDASPTPQGEHHYNWSAILNMEKSLPGQMKLTSITGYRAARSHFLYDQSGIGPENPYGLGLASAPQDAFAFAFPVQFNERTEQVSQELRLSSDYAVDNPLDWIAGLYYEHDHTQEINTFWAENIVGGPLASIEGQDLWNDAGGTETYAFFVQAGYRILDDLKLTAGVRYTHDEKSGFVTALVQQYGDRYNGYVNTTPLTTLVGCGGSGSTPTCAVGSAGYPNYATPYGHSWDAVTPQAILRYTPTKDLMAYFTVGRGFKGGGFENDTNNAAPAFAAQTPYAPETDWNYELGLKSRFWDQRLQLNLAAYYTQYDNLQVEQTIDSCLCNIINNAGNAEFKGIEAEFEARPNRRTHFWLSGSLENAKYLKFIDAAGNNDSGKTAQRTPNYQFVIGGEFTADLPSMPDALLFHLTYKQQGRMYWDPANLTHENAYGLLDGRLTFTLPNGAWSVSLWGKNLTDTQFRTNIISFFGDEVGTYGPPRTFGAEFSAKF
ncbi:TonB-dependent receptor [Phenylobacterium montanum]|uniref:TonB-dependent receptor n=1 Tax=Phenylobacterium montanum TaxID=2823693 RepID=A0A975IW45_9CAUL|nr:TonB-dependent receptor [Caulobacter sp. S6]QUD89493.1 TonB-dependent receptor [Caulobacter sp. S6]